MSWISHVLYTHKNFKVKLARIVQARNYCMPDDYVIITKTTSSQAATGACSLRFLAMLFVVLSGNFLRPLNHGCWWFESETRFRICHLDADKA